MRYILHSGTSRTITIVVTGQQGFLVMVLQPFLKRQGIEFTTESKLPVYFFLGDVEVFDVEEADIRNGMVQFLDELFLAAWLVEFAEVECNELSPVHCRISYHSKNHDINQSIKKSRVVANYLTIFLGHWDLLILFNDSAGHLGVV